MLGFHAGVEMHKNLKKFFAIALTASLLITSSVPMQLSAANGDISEYGVEKFEVDNYTVCRYQKAESNEQGAYLLTGSAEWLQIPAFRMIDAFGITAQHIAVEMIDGYPAAEGYYIYKMLNTTTTSYRHDFEATEFEDPSGYTYTGVATKFNLPNDVGTTDCIYFYVYLEVRVLIDHPELTTNFDIKASYCHARAQFSLNPSIEICGEDIVGAVGLTMTTVKDTRATAIRFNYSPD